MSNYKAISRNDLNVKAAKIELLAKELQQKLTAANSNDLLGVSNELWRNTSLFIFQLGELFNAENNSTKTVTATTATTTPKKVNLNYHNKRDARGRFTP